MKDDNESAYYPALPTDLRVEARDWMIGAPSTAEAIRLLHLAADALEELSVSRSDTLTERASEREGERAARAVAEAHLWPGAWDKMGEAERDHARVIAEAVMRALSPTSDQARRDRVNVQTVMAYEEGQAQGRREALEEAATLCERAQVGYDEGDAWERGFSGACTHNALNIRALAAPTTDQGRGSEA